MFNVPRAACPYKINIINYLFINILSLHKYKDIHVYRHSGTRHVEVRQNAEKQNDAEDKD